MSRTIKIYESAEEIAAAASDFMAEQALEAIASRGRFTIALAGGTSVRTAYEQFAASADIDWSKVFFFWSDDRFIDSSTSFSNYGLAKSAIFDQQSAIPKENIFPIPYPAPNPVIAAQQYSQTIQTFFSLNPGEWPRFDLIQLGMGPDGHTASLFPNRPAVTIVDKIVTMTHAGLEPWIDRLTFTLPTINSARCVLFLAAGEKKAETLRRVLEDAPDYIELPSSGVNPSDGEAVWMLDKGIASQLKS